MKRIFLSLPMSGRSDEEIRDQIKEMKAIFLLKNSFERGEDIYFVHNFQEMQVVTNAFDQFEGERKTPALYYLGRAINKIAYCDGVYFGEGWADARGCLVEMAVCDEYNIPKYADDNSGGIIQLNNIKGGIKKIRVDFSISGELDGLRPVSKIASTLYEAERSKIPILMDEETMIIYAPICTRSHFEAFYGKVFEKEEEHAGQ